MIEALEKLEIQGIFLNTIKALYNKPRANIIVSGEQLKQFTLKLGMRQSCPLPPLLFNKDELNREFSREEVQMASKYMKKCSTSLVIKDICKPKQHLDFISSPS
jgi:hypothetical protein